jgi:hypothetical protein
VGRGGTAGQCPLILIICTCLSSEAQQIVVGGEATYYRLWLNAKEESLRGCYRLLIV